MNKVVFKRSMLIRRLYMSSELLKGFTEIGCITIEDILTAKFGTLIRNELLLRNWSEMTDIICKLKVMYSYLRYREIAGI